MTFHRVAIDGVPPFRMRTHARGDSYISRQIEEAGVWEPVESALVAQLLRPGDVFVDLGANIGYYTVLAALACGPRGTVHAFEPEPGNFRLLRENVALNGLANVTAVEAAVSSASGSVDLFLSHDNQGDHRIYDNESRASRVRVRQVSLDDWFRGRDSRVDVVKMDTQGSEGRIIDGMEGLIDANRERMRMVVEFWPYGLEGSGDSAAGLVERLARFDFAVSKVDESLPGPVPTSWEALLVEAQGIYHPSTRHYTNLLLVPRA
jgi:FkbM family methyltransferase